MKKIIAGTGFEITGALMLLFPSLIASISLEKTTEWNTQLGRYWQTIFNLGLLPVIIIGSVLLIMELIYTGEMKSEDLYSELGKEKMKNIFRTELKKKKR